MKHGVAEAVDSMFALCEAIDVNKLSIDDLREGCRLAVDGGHGLIEIDLAMMSNAVRLSKTVHMTEA